MDEAKRLELTLLSLERNLRHNGGTPSTFLETLADVLERRDWEKMDISFQQMIETPPPHGIGSSVEELRKVIQLKHRYEDIDKVIAERMAWLRREFQREFNGSAENRLEHGGERKGVNFQGNNITLKTKRGTSKDYILKRLYRDHRELYEMVLNKEMRPTKAAEKAGFLKKPLQLTSNVKLAAKKLRKYYAQEDLHELIRLLLSDE